MKTIVERAREYAENEDLVQGTDGFDYCLRDYIKGATEQKAIDIEKVCDWLSNYFVFEHEAMSAAGCDAFLRKLRKALEE